MSTDFHLKQISNVIVKVISSIIWKNGHITTTMTVSNSSESCVIIFILGTFIPRQNFFLNPFVTSETPELLLFEKLLPGSTLSFLSFTFLFLNAAKNRCY